MKAWGWVGVALGIIILIAVVLFIPLQRAEAQVPSITVAWTSPGDDGNVGTATSYQIRYRFTPIAGTDTTTWWNGATVVPNPPVPKLAGTPDSMVVAGPFSSGTSVYFIIRALDEALNVSGFSNVAVKMVPDAIAPNRIIDLIAR